jgi:hypothetical protein
MQRFNNTGSLKGRGTTWKGGSTMRTMLTLALTLVLLGAPLLSCGKNAVERRAATPSFKELLKQEPLTGEVVNIGRNYLSIREVSGETVRVPVDNGTKMDRVELGDTVTAYLSDSGRATTVERVEPVK